MGLMNEGLYDLWVSWVMSFEEIGVAYLQVEKIWVELKFGLWVKVKIDVQMEILLH